MNNRPIRIAYKLDITSNRQPGYLTGPEGSADYRNLDQVRFQLQGINETLLRFRNDSDKKFNLVIKSEDNILFGFSNIYTWQLFFNDINNDALRAMTIEQHATRCNRREIFYRDCNLKNLDAAIAQLNDAGENITKIDPANAGCGYDAMRLASCLRSHITTLIEPNNSLSVSDNVENFKNSITYELSRRIADTSQHRNLWTPILANIAIALTGVGLVAIAVKLLHSKLTTGQCSFFSYKTNRQSAVERIEQEVAKCGLIAH